MVFYQRKKLPGKNEHYSFLKILRDEGRSCEEFEMMLSNLSMEEVISAKLETTIKNTFNGKFYGYPLFQKVSFIVRNALLHFALSVTTSQREASRLLGITENSFIQQIKKYKIEKQLNASKEEDIDE